MAKYQSMGQDLSLCKEGYEVSINQIFFFLCSSWMKMVMMLHLLVCCNQTTLHLSKSHQYMALTLNSQNLSPSQEEPTGLPKT